MQFQHAKQEEEWKELGSILNSILISEGKAMTPRMLSRIYADVEGDVIPYRKFHYPSLLDLLYNMNDVLYVKNINGEEMLYPVTDEKTQHIFDMVVHQRPKPKPKPKLKSRATSGSYQTGRGKSRFNTYGGNNRFRSTYNGYVARPKTKKIPSELMYSIVIERLKTAPGNTMRKMELLQLINAHPSSRGIQYSFTELDKQLRELTHLLFIHDHAVVLKEQTPVQVQNSPQKILKDEEYDVEEFYDVDSEGMSEIYENAPVNTFDENHTNETRKDAGSLVKERTKIRLQMLIDKHPEGIWSSELAQYYLDEYKIELEYEDLGFGSITEFVAALPEIFKCEYQAQARRPLILSAKSLSNTQKKTLCTLYNMEDYLLDKEDAVPMKLPGKISDQLIPHNVMNHNETVEQLSASLLRYNPLGYEEVYVSEIFTLSFFWIQLRKYRKKLKALMGDLQSYYMSFNQKELDGMRIPEVLLKEGMNVACVYGKEWHRGMIKKLKIDGYVMILFYDYGTIKTYHPKDIYYLSRLFSKLPAQAIPCGLANLKPYQSEEWSQKVINEFLDKVWDIPLIAQVNSVDEETNSAMLSLVDTSEDDYDFHINDWLLDMKYADRGKMVNVPVHQVCNYDEVILYAKIKQERERQKIARSSSINPKTVSLEFEQMMQKMDSDKARIIMNEMARLVTIVSGLEGSEESNISVENSTISKLPNPTVDKPHSSNVDDAVDYECVMDEGTLSFSIEDNQGTVPISEQNGHVEKSKEQQAWSRLTLVENFKNNNSVSLESVKNNSSIQKNLKIDNNNVENVKNRNVDLRNNESEYNSKILRQIGNHKSDGETQLKTGQKIVLPWNNVNSISKFAKISYFIFFPRKRDYERYLHVVRINGDGWVCTDEVVKYFTNLKDKNIMIKLLELLHLPVNYKQIARVDNPQLFESVEKNFSRDKDVELSIDENGLLQKLHLLPLKDVLKILLKLNFINKDLLTEALAYKKQNPPDLEIILFEKYANTILYDVLKLIMSYSEYISS